MWSGGYFVWYPYFITFCATHTNWSPANIYTNIREWKYQYGFPVLILLNAYDKNV